MKLNLFVKLKYQSSTMTLFVGIKYSLRDLLCGINNDLQSSDMLAMVGLYDVSAPSGISSP